jgi:hypothetical protein
LKRGCAALEKYLMNGPFALIGGDLALPLLRPFDGVPPPFGAYGTATKAAAQKAVRQNDESADGRRPTKVRHTFFYQPVPPRAKAGNFDAAMEEVRRYLSMETVRHKSSRSDYLLGAAIFVGYGIGLSWLLATSSMPEMEKSKPTAVKPGLIMAPNVSGQRPSTITPLKTTPRTPPRAATKPEPAVTQASAGTAKPDGQTWDAPQAGNRKLMPFAAQEKFVLAPQKAGARVGVAHLSDAHVQARMRLNRKARPVAHPSASAQPEWMRGAASNGQGGEQAGSLVWAARHQRAPVEVYAAPSSDEHWDGHMTQRRVMDDPDAFLGSHGE